jgi:hypothetical protein
MNDPNYHVLRPTNIRGAEPDYILGTVLRAKKVQTIDRKYEIENLLDELMESVCIYSDNLNSPSEKLNIHEVFEMVAARDKEFKKRMRNIILDLRAESSQGGNF